MNENEIKLLAILDQKTKSHQEQINEVREGNKVFRDEIREEIKDLKDTNKLLNKVAISVEVVANTLKTVMADVTEVKQGQKDLTQKVDNQISDIKNKVADVEIRPDKDIAETVKKIKIAIITSIATFIVTGILGSIIIFAIK